MLSEDLIYNEDTRWAQNRQYKLDIAGLRKEVNSGREMVASLNHLHQIELSQRDQDLEGFKQTIKNDGNTVIQLRKDIESLHNTLTARDEQIKRLHRREVEIIASLRRELEEAHTAKVIFKK